MRINNKFKDNKKIIVLLFVVLMYVLSPLLINNITYSVENMTFTRKELQDMVVSTALSYLYNNVYTDYDQNHKDKALTVNDISTKPSYMWVNFEQSPEEISRTNNFFVACSAFVSTVYRHSLGYDFSDYYRLSSYTYFKDGKYYLPYCNSEDYNEDCDSKINENTNLYHQERMNQKLYKEMTSLTGHGPTTTYFLNIAKDELKNKSENSIKSSSTGAYIYNDLNDNVQGIYYFQSASSSSALEEIANTINEKKRLIKEEIESLLKPGDLIVYERIRIDENGEEIKIDGSNGHVVLYVEDAISDNSTLCDIQSDGTETNCRKEVGLIHSTGVSYKEDGTSANDDRYGVRYDPLDIDNILLKKVNDTTTAITYRIAVIRPINKFCKRDSCSVPTGDSEFSKAVNTDVISNTITRNKLSRLRVEQWAQIDKIGQENDYTYSNTLGKYNSVNVGDIITYNLLLQNKANYTYCTDGSYYNNYTSKDYSDFSCKQNNEQWKTISRADEFEYNNLTITSVVPNGVEYIDGSCKILYEAINEQDQNHPNCTYNKDTRIITWKVPEIKANNKEINHIYNVKTPKYVYSYDVKVMTEGTIINEGMKIITNEDDILQMGKIETDVNPTINEFSVSKIESFVSVFKEKNEAGQITYNGFKTTGNYNVNINDDNKINLAEGEFIKMLYYNVFGIDIGYLSVGGTNNDGNILTAIFNKNTDLGFYTKKENSDIEQFDKNKNQYRISKMLVPGMYGGRILRGNDNGDREIMIKVKNSSWNDTGKIGVSDFEFGDIIYTYTNAKIDGIFMYYGLDENGYAKFIQFELDGVKIYTGKEAFNKVTKIYASDLFWVLRPSRVYGTTVIQDNGDGTQNVLVEYKKYNNLLIPTRDGYIFDGWYTDDNIKIENGQALSKNTSHTVYARWIDNTELGGTFVIDCDNANILPSSSKTCSIKGKNFSKQVSFITAKLKIGENLNLVNVNIDKDVWSEGGVLENKIDVYTDANKTGDFNLGTFTIESSAINIGFNSKITLEDIVINQTYDIDNVSFDLRILSGVNTLSSLTVSDYDFDFNSNIFEYYLEVPTEVSEITISGITTDENATVTGIGTESLDYGTNNFDIVVISESGVKKTYNLIVNRTETVIFNDKIKEDRENNRLYIVIDRTESLVVNTLLDKMETIANLIVTNNKGVTMSGTDKVGTGSNVKIDLSNEALNYKIVVLGDTTGDGKVNVIDVTKLYQQYRGTIETQMSDVEIVAGDVMKDNVIKLNDIAKLYQYVQGTYPTLE